MFEDKKLVCKDCGMEFIFTAGEQSFYASKGFSDPQRCKFCRDNRKVGNYAYNIEASASVTHSDDNDIVTDYLEDLKEKNKARPKAKTAKPIIDLIGDGEAVAECTISMNKPINWAAWKQISNDSMKIDYLEDLKSKYGRFGIRSIASMFGCSVAITRNEMNRLGVHFDRPLKKDQEAFYEAMNVVPYDDNNHKRKKATGMSTKQKAVAKKNREKLKDANNKIKELESEIKHLKKSDPPFNIEDVNISTFTCEIDAKKVADLISALHIDGNIRITIDMPMRLDEQESHIGFKANK